MENFTLATTEDSEYMTVEDVQKMLRISRTSVYALIHVDGFPMLKIGRRCIIPRKEFLSWLENIMAHGGRIVITTENKAN